MVILVINSISNLAALLIILSGFNRWKLSKWFYVVFFILAFITDIYINISGNSLLYYRIILEIIILSCFLKRIIDSAFYVMAAETMIICLVFLVGPIIYLSPGIINNHIYNILVAAIIVAASIVIRKLLIQFNQYFTVISERVKLGIVFLEVVTIVPITVIYQLFSTREQLLFITSILMVYMILVGLTTIQGMKIVAKNRELKIRQDSAEIQKKLIEQNYGKLSHFIEPAFRLLRESVDAGDVNEIKKIFADHLEPIYHRHIQASQMEQLNLIDMKSIRACVYDAMLRTNRNAINHIKDQPDGVINLSLFQNNIGCFIEIENTYYGGEPFLTYQICKNRNEEGHMGFGLRYTKELLDQSNIIYATYLRANMFE